MQATLKILVFVFGLLCLFFVALGLYSLDAILLSVAALFAVAVFLLIIEMKKFSHPSL